jgi:dipeptidyl aminopeptidase/acylaminoacyl peptidase
MTMLAERPVLTADRYARAEQLLLGHAAELIVGGEITPDFIPGGDRFWFLDRVPGGHRFLIADPAAGSVTPAFDHERLAGCLGRDSGQECDPRRLPFGRIQFLEDGSFYFAAFGRQWRYHDGTCEDAGDAAEWLTWSVSPDGHWAVKRVANDVALIEIATGCERRLTDDGTEGRRYGTHLGSWTFRVERTGGWALQPVIAWSPDSSLFALELIDETRVGRGYLIETIEHHPRLHSFAFALPEDEHVPMSSLFVVSVADGTLTPVELAPVPSVLEAQIGLGNVWWSADSTRLEVVARDRYFREAQLIAVDPATGTARTLVDERAETLVAPAEGWDRPCARTLMQGGVLWCSHRDGWGHLWRVEDGTWMVLTSGSWLVRELLHVDEEAGLAYFTASGREPGRHPYHRYLYRIGFDGGEPELLTPEDADHQVTFSPSGRWFVDSFSSNTLPPATVVRRSGGEVAIELGIADTARLRATAWREPIPFVVKAADGETDIYGVLYPPPEPDESARVPIVDCIYPGPFRGPSQFRFGLSMRHCEAIAALGLATVTIEARGTANRSRAFEAVSYGELDLKTHLADHVAAIEQLADRYPWIDLERVGIIGVSGGGYATVRAMLTRPDVFRVGVAIAGDHDRRRLSGWAEPYLGPVHENVEAWERQSNLPLAGELQGKLLLAWGCMDNNVPPYASLAFLQALIDANKDVDLLVLPNEDHFSYFSDPYFVRRMWDYLVQHLRGEDPPPYQISLRSLMRVF